MTRRLRLPGKRGRILLGVLAVLAAIYFLIVLLVIPWLVPSRVSRLASTRTGLDVQIGGLRAHPFTWEVTATEVAVSTPETGPLVSVEALRVDPRVTSLFGSELTADAIHIERPHLNVHRDAGGKWNLLTALDKVRHQASPEQQEAERTDFRVGHLTISAGSVSFADEAVPTPVKREITPIELDARNLTTSGTDEGVLTVSATTRLVEHLDLSLRVDVASGKATGTFSANDVRIADLDVYLRDMMPPYWAIAEGTGNASGAFSLSFGGEFAASAQDLTASVGGLVLVDGPQEIAGWEELTIGPTKVAWPEGQVEIGRVEIRRPYALVDRQADGSLSVLAGWPSPGKDQPTPPADAAPPTLEIGFAGLAITEGKVSLSDASVPGGAEVTVDIPTLTIGAGTYPGPNAIPVAGSFVALGGTLTFEAEATAVPFGASGHLRADGLRLGSLLPYGATFLTATQGEGVLTGDLEFSWPVTAEVPVLTGQAALHDLVLEDADGQLLVRTAAVEVTGLTVTDLDPTIAVERIYLGEPFIAAGVGPTGQPRLAILRAEAGEDTSAEGDASAPPGAPTPEVRVGAFIVERGQVIVQDQRFERPVLLRVDDLAATGSELAFGQGLGGTLTVQAIINESGELRIDASADLPANAEANRAEIALRLDNLLLRTVSAYAETATGYGIAGGRMDIESAFNLNGPLLSGTNIVDLRQFDLGPRTDQPDARVLPLPLALTLMRDLSGNIHLDIPVSGRIDDPGFRLGRVMLQVFTNIITRAVASPFRILGGIVGLGGGGDDLGEVVFAPGASELSDTERPEIEALATALKARPALQLRVPLAVAATEDEAALFSAAQPPTALPPASEELPAPAPAPAATTPAETSPDATAATTTGGTEYEPPTAPQGPRGRRPLPSLLQGRGWAFWENAPSTTEAQQPTTPEALPDAAPDTPLDEGIVSGPAGVAAAESAAPQPSLEQLARARAEAIRDALAAQGIEANRLRVDETVSAAALNPAGQVVVELAIE